ncbi:hypothetical protein FRB90_009762 [Tulasnella sp. 427]|nr:hypothetical protein FRB90_009762 [Tulasnella sp. 427]
MFQGSLITPKVSHSRLISENWLKEQDVDDLAPPENILTEDIQVFLEYDMNNPPPRPDGDEWTRFVCISDTHGKSFPVPPGDVLLHAGDLTPWGKAKELRRTMGEPISELLLNEKPTSVRFSEWITSLPHSVKIVIAGNHDFALDRTTYTELSGSGDPGDEEELQEMDEAKEVMRGELARGGNVVYLSNESHEVSLKPEGRQWKVYGSPWTPYFGGMAFNYTKEEAEGIHDKTTRGEIVGCPTLLAHLNRLRPKLHVFGHIHEARGATIHHWDTDSGAEDGVPKKNNITVFVNPANQPTGAKARANGRWAQTGRRSTPDAKIDMRPTNRGMTIHRIHAATTTTSLRLSDMADDESARAAYEAAKNELVAAINKKRQVDKSLATIENNLWNFESSYLQDTANSGGNIIQGFEGYLKASAGGRRKTEPNLATDMIFSNSSSTSKQQQGYEMNQYDEPVQPPTPTMSTVALTAATPADLRRDSRNARGQRKRTEDPEFIPPPSTTSAAGSRAGRPNKRQKFTDE